MNAPLVLAVDAVPPAPGPGLRMPRPSLGHCLLLATLLHLWLVALVGTAPGGPALPGEGVWSTIQVRLSGAGPADSPGRAEAPLPYSGPVGRAPEPRFGGTVREAPPRPSPEPGAAELGVWAPRPLPVPPGSPAAPTQSTVEAAAAPVPPPVLTRTPPRAPERPEDPAAAPAAPPSLTEPPPRAAPDATPAPSTAPRLSPVDTVEAPALDRPAQLQRDIANPAPTPSAAQRPLPAPAPRLPLPPPRALPLPEAAAPLSAPVPVPLTLPPSLPPAPPPSPAPAALPAPPAAAPPVPGAANLAPPPEPAAAPLPATAPPPLPSPALEPRSPPRLAPLNPLDVGTASRPAPADLALPPVRSPEAAPVAGTGGPAAGNAATAPVRDSVLPLAPPVPAPGRATVAPQLGTDRATPPPAAASGAALNLELPRPRATLPGLAAPRVLNLVPPPPERRSPLSEGIEKAAKPDCRKAYAGMGVLGVVPLAADALRDGGCRW